MKLGESERLAAMTRISASRNLCADMAAECTIMTARPYDAVRKFIHDTERVSVDDSRSSRNGRNSATAGGGDGNDSAMQGKGLLMQETTPVSPVAAFRHPEELARLRPVILVLLRSRRRQRRLAKHELLLRLLLRRRGRLIAVVVVRLRLRWRRTPRLGSSWRRRITLVLLLHGFGPH